MPFLNNRILDRAIRGGFTGGMGDFSQSPQTPPFVPDQTPGRLAPMQPQAQPRPLAIQQPQPSPAEQTHQQEFNRLTGAGPDPNQGKSGIQQIKNPVGRTLLTALDAIGSGLFPRIAMNIPGTQAHHNLLLNQEGAALEQEQQNRKDTSAEQLQAAQAELAASKPELTQAGLDLKNEQGLRKQEHEQAVLAQNQAKIEGQQDLGNRQLEARHREHGLKTDPATGALVPIPLEEMTPQEQANYEAKAAQKELAEATAQLRRAQATGDGPSQELAKMRLDIANRRLGLSQQVFDARFKGIVGGQPMPGALLTDDNKVVPPVNAQNVRPTGTERTRADLASSAGEQLRDMEEIVKRRPDLFGPGAGRITAFKNWIGSEDADAKAFLSARQILADHAAGVFGGRSEYATHAQEIAAGRLNDNPQAMLAGMRQIQKAMENIGDKGIVKTVGSKAAAAPSGLPEVKTQDEYNRLPKGAEYMEIGPDGKQHKLRKP